MKDVRQLVRIKHGSHLYGTATPLSDLDIKGVHLPSGRSILLQRAEDVITNDVVAKEGSKNTADAVDDQSYSLQKFLGMLAAGDTVATEILFAPDSAVISFDPWWKDIQTYGRRMINRQAKGFVGYCQRQAAKYGIKGSRMSAVKKLLDILDKEVEAGHGQLKLQTIVDVIKPFAQEEDHVAWVNIPSPNGDDCWHIDCCDRKMPMSASIKTAWNVYTKMWDNYGDRARLAMTNQGIDWKAISHAVRVARQALELLQDHTITFPRPDAQELLEIKQGLRVYKDVSPMLEDLVVRVNACESTLPEQTNMVYLDEVVEFYYHSQIRR